MAPIGKNHLIAACLAIVAELAGCGDKEQSKPRTGASATPPVATPTAPPTPMAPLPTASTPAAAASTPATVPPGATAPEPTPSAAPSPPALTAGSSPTPASAPAPALLASQEFSNDPSLRADILEVKRVSGGALLVKWRLSRQAAASAGGLAAPAADDKGVYHSFSWSHVYVTDPAENKKYSGLKDSGGQWIGQGDNKTYARGQQQAMWMKFPAPPASSTKISFVFSGFPPFDDMPVSQ